MMVMNESDVLLAASVDGKSNWILGSRNAYHLCKDREIFFTYTTCERLVQMANNTENRVVGEGIVQFRMKNRRSLTLNKVRHVFSLKKI